MINKTILSQAIKEAHTKSVIAAADALENLKLIYPQPSDQPSPERIENIAHNGGYSCDDAVVLNPYTVEKAD